MRVALVVGIVAAGCYSPTPAPGSPCNTKGECPAGLECRNNICELPGGDGGAGGEGQVDAAPDAMIDACPGAMCVNDKLVGCGASITCENGCSADPDPHCRVLRPSNQITTALLQGATADFSTGDIEIDTSTGRINAGSTELRPAGTGILNGIRFAVVDNTAVFAANSFSIPADARWDIDGSNPLVLYAATTITIDGNLDATATLSTAGPGGSGSNSSTTTNQCRGRAGRLLSAQHGEGGGGGGGVTVGGNGGASDAANPTGDGGPTCSSRSTTIPLRGGAGGGAGAANSANAGGGGGGAVALVAMGAIAIPAGGIVSVSGGGGLSGAVGAPGSGEAGGGGGAAGAVLLEAPIVSVAGAVTANGGSGASPSVVDGRDGNLASGLPVAGGRFTGPGGVADGGGGGAQVATPTNGETYNYNDGMLTATSITSRGAGGGGASGRIAIRASVVTTAGAVISPAASNSTPDYE